MTKNPLKLYAQTKEWEARFIRNHPFQFIAINAIVLAGFIGYSELQDRKFMRELEKDRITETPQTV